jgi:hypothetical protein
VHVHQTSLPMSWADGAASTRFPAEPLVPIQLITCAQLFAYITQGTWQTSRARTCVNQDEGQLHQPVPVLVVVYACEGDHAMCGILAERLQCEGGTHCCQEAAPAGLPASTSDA